MALLIAGADLTLDGVDNVHRRVVRANVEDALNESLARGDGEFTVSGNVNNSVDSVLERGDPVGNETGTRPRATVSKVLRVSKLANVECAVSNLVFDSKLFSPTECFFQQNERVETHLHQAGVRERNVDARDLEELRGPAGLLRCLLVGGDPLTVLLNLGGGGDQGDEEGEPLAELGDIVVNLEEDVVLDPLRETGPGEIA